MSDPIGHDAILRTLKTAMPRFSIFEGEQSVGKWTTALWVRDRLRVPDIDYLEVKHLDMESAHGLTRFLTSAPFYAARLAVILLTGTTGAAAQNVLLATLEDLPASSLVIIVTSPDAIIPALRSRGTVFQFRTLRQEDVKQILMARHFGEATANHLASLSGGHVTTALRFANSNETKVTVIGCVRALRNRDAKALDTFSTRWTDEHTSLLTTMCTEAITGRVRIFEKDDTDTMGKRLAMKILATLRPTVRPRLVVHAQLMSVLRGEG